MLIDPQAAKIRIASLLQISDRVVQNLHHRISGSLNCAEERVVFEVMISRSQCDSRAAFQILPEPLCLQKRGPDMRFLNGGNLDPGVLHAHYSALEEGVQ